MEYVEAGNVATNRSHMKWMLEKILASVVPSAEGRLGVRPADEGRLRQDGADDARAGDADRAARV